MKPQVVGMLVLWAVLASIVLYLINRAGDEWGFAVSLAMFAWLGGLVTSELLQIMYNRFKKERR